MPLLYTVPRTSLTGLSPPLFPDLPPFQLTSPQLGHSPLSGQPPPEYPQYRQRLKRRQRLTRFIHAFFIAYIPPFIQICQPDVLAVSISRSFDPNSAMIGNFLNQSRRVRMSTQRICSQKRCTKANSCSSRPSSSLIIFPVASRPDTARRTGFFR